MLGNEDAFSFDERPPIHQSICDEIIGDLQDQLRNFDFPEEILDHVRPYSPDEIEHIYAGRPATYQKREETEKWDSWVGTTIDIFIEELPDYIAIDQLPTVIIEWNKVEKETPAGRTETITRQEKRHFDLDGAVGFVYIKFEDVPHLGSLGGEITEISINIENGDKGAISIGSSERSTPTVFHDVYLVRKVDDLWQLVKYDFPITTYFTAFNLMMWECEYDEGYARKIL